MPKFEDLTGKTFNSLTVIKQGEPRFTKGGNKQNTWICQCKCGKQTLVTAGNLKNGNVKSCGCANKAAHLLRRKDLTGQRFGRLTVESLAERRQTPNGTNVSYWNCLCDCGNRKVVRHTSLTKSYATSCGCYRKEVVSQTKTNNLIGRIFGKLTVLSRAGSKEISNGKRALWLCQCECGNKKIVQSTCLLSGNTQSCGCVKASIGEDCIKRLLNTFSVKYKTEYTFNDLRSRTNTMLRFDFALFDNSNKLICLIEYQGVQHFKKNAYGFGALQREETDQLKREYCKQNNITLIEVAYNEDFIEKVIDVITNLVYHANSVPSPVRINWEGVTTISEESSE